MYQSVPKHSVIHIHVYKLYQSVPKTFCDTYTIQYTCINLYWIRASQKHYVILIHVYILNQSVPKHSVIHKHVYIESKCPKSILWYIYMYIFYQSFPKTFCDTYTCNVYIESECAKSILWSIYMYILYQCVPKNVTSVTSAFFKKIYIFEIYLIW